MNNELKEAVGGLMWAGGSVGGAAGVAAAAFGAAAIPAPPVIQIAAGVAGAAVSLVTGCYLSAKGMKIACDC